MRGPIDFIVVGFEGNKFTGGILSELQKAADAGTIAVLALSVIAKDADGAVVTLDATEDMVMITATEPVDSDLITEDDINEVGDLLEPNTAAGLLIVEQLWAKGLKSAIIDAGGSLVVDGRIHPDAVAELELTEEN